jgi:antitoxin component of RelBE/YafQ-DinJ toxin-antitoxin module
MVNSEKLTITVKKGQKQQVKKIMQDMGMKTSSYVAIVFQSLIDSQTKTFKQVFDKVGENVAKEIKKEMKKKVKAK